MNDEMRGRWALVTGAGGEIGRETALHLAAAGVNVVATDIAADRAEATAHAVEAAGATAQALPLDVGNFDAVTTGIAAASKRVGGFDYLVNSAGIDGVGAIEDLSPEFIARVFTVNVYGIFYACRAVLPAMMARRRGAIVNVASVHAQNGQANAATYAATKGAIISFTKSLAREKAASGIRANAVAPGPINTALWRGGDAGERLEQRIRERIKVIPLARIGMPSDVAGVIVFLLSPAAAFVTGQVVPVGGGEIMR